MVSKKIIVTALLASGMMLLGGCDNTEEVIWTPQKSAAVSISEEGSITEYIQEKLDASYYDYTELQSMINAEVDSYNKKYGADSIKVNSFVSEDKTVKLEMEYARSEDYSRFNNVEFYYGSLLRAQLAGYLFDGSYQRVRNGSVKGSAVEGTEVIKDVDVQVLVVRAPLEVHVPGEVTFISTNAEMLGADDVYATGKQEEEGGLILPSNAVYKDDDTTFAEQAAANRVYIIFEQE